MYNDEFKLFTANTIAKYGILPLTGNLSPIETKALLYIIWKCNAMTPGCFETVEMNISELCKALGYHHDKNNNFARVMKFLSDAVTGLTIPFKVSADSGKKFLSMAWLQTVYADYDADSLKVRFNSDIGHYFGKELEKTFTVVKLKYLNRLKTSAAVTLYPFFCRYRYMESFNYSLEELICLVGASKTCDYKHLKRNYLAPAIQIINEKTDINVTFTENKKGRKVTSLAFSVKAFPATLEMEEFLTWNGMAETEENKKQYDEEWMEMREYDMSRQCYHDVIFT